MKSRHLALLAAFTVALLYAANFSLAKEVMPAYVEPYGFIWFRVLGAGALLWLVSLFGPRENIEKSDIPRLLAAGFFGVGLNMLAFFKGLSLTTPINAAVLMITTPMIVLLVTQIILKERMAKRRIAGILIGFGGTFLLISQSTQSGENAANPVLGNVLVFINAASYAIYLVLIKKLIEKYHPLTLIKWLYLIGFVVVTPFGLDEAIQINWEAIPAGAMLSFAYVIVGATFLTYLLNIFAIKMLKPAIIAAFVYLQPFLATLISVIWGTDELDNTKLLAGGLIFAGVYLTSLKSKSEKVLPVTK